jgi:toxin HigB-1
MERVIMYDMIISYKCKKTESLSKGNYVKQFSNIASIGRRKLRQIEIADRLDDLRVPPGNHLEALKGSRSGQHSIRINDKWRICFCWTDSGAEGVEIVDYH